MKKRHRVLLTSAGNRGADSMAESLHEEVTKLVKESLARKDAFVVRLHSIKTERMIFLGNPLKTRQNKSNSGSKEKSTQTAHQLSRNATDVIMTHCQTFAKGKFEGVDDERVQNIELSLGTLMKKMVGIDETQPYGNVTAAENKPKLLEFLKLYKLFIDGTKMSLGDMIAFHEGIKFLMGYTIQKATAICATVAGAADSLVTRNYKDAELIVVDEAARVPEYQ